MIEPNMNYHWSPAYLRTEPLSWSFVDLLRECFIDPGWDYDFKEPTLRNILPEVRTELRLILDSHDLSVLSEGQLLQMVRDYDPESDFSSRFNVYRLGTSYKELLDFCREWLRENPGTDSPTAESAD
jgi:hypothetical protein